MNEIIFTLLTSGGIFLCGIIIGLASSNLVEGKISTLIAEAESQPDDCSGLNLWMSAACLQSEMKQYYRYNYTNINKDLDYADLKILGGVCWHYAKVYFDRAKELGFYAEQVTIDTSNESMHRFTVMSNEEGWVALDQTCSCGCRLKNGEMEEKNEISA